MLSQIFANPFIGGRTAQARRAADPERHRSFSTRLLQNFHRKPDISSGLALGAAPERRPDIRPALSYGTLFYLAGTAFVGAIIIGVFFGIGLYSLAHSTEQSGAGFDADLDWSAAPVLQAAKPPTSDGIVAGPPVSAATAAARLAGAPAVTAPAGPPASKPAGPNRFAAASREFVAGKVVEVADAMTWVVANSTIHLWGIRPGPQSSASSLEKFVDWARARSPLECHKHAHSSRYRCSTATGEDVAEAALLAGVGRAAEGATGAYRNAEARAHRQGKGLWAGP